MNQSAELALCVLVQHRASWLRVHDLALLCSVCSSIRITMSALLAPMPLRLVHAETGETRSALWVFLPGIHAIGPVLEITDQEIYHKTFEYLWMSARSIRVTTLFGNTLARYSKPTHLESVSADKIHGSIDWIPDSVRFLALGPAWDGVYQTLDGHFHCSRTKPWPSALTTLGITTMRISGIPRSCSHTIPPLPGSLALLCAHQCTIGSILRFNPNLPSLSKMIIDCSGENKSNIPKAVRNVHAPNLSKVVFVNFTDSMGEHDGRMALMFIAGLPNSWTRSIDDGTGGNTVTWSLESSKSDKSGGLPVDFVNLSMDIMFSGAPPSQFIE